MDLLKNFYKKTEEKISKGGSKVCSSQNDAFNLTKQVAETLLLGKGNADELLQNAGKTDKEHKGCSNGCSH